MSRNDLADRVAQAERQLTELSDQLTNLLRLTQQTRSAVKQLELRAGIAPIEFLPNGAAHYSAPGTRPGPDNKRSRGPMPSGTPRR